MKIVEKKTPFIGFEKIKVGQVFKSDEGIYYMKIDDIQTYDDDEDEEFWINAVALRDGSTIAFLDSEQVELVENGEFVVY